MARKLFIDYERGYSGEYIIYVNGKRYCTVDNYEEYKQAKYEILNQDLSLLV